MRTHLQLQPIIYTNTQLVNDMFISGSDEPGMTRTSDVVCLARVGTDTQKIVTSSLEDAIEVDMGPPLHSLVIPGHCHFLEQDSLNMWRHAS